MIQTNVVLFVTLQDNILQALQYVPSIVQLQRVLINKYQCKLDKAEANTTKISQIIKGNCELFIFNHMQLFKQSSHFRAQIY